MRAGLSAAEARRYYDRNAARQDRQGWYEDAPLAAMIAAGDFASSAAVLELGCGTGRLAETLLARHLPVGARYLGLDISRSMLKRASGRLRRFTARARLAQADATTRLPLRDESVDRCVAAYLIDLLAQEDANTLSREAHRVLAPGGLICLASLSDAAHGTLPRLAAWLWATVHHLAPTRVGGCRPVLLRPLLATELWQPVHVDAVVAGGLASEIIVARKRLID